MRIDPLKLLPVTGRIETQPSDAVRETEKSFGQFLTEAIGEVNKLQNDAVSASVNLAAGKVQDISEVVIASEKAAIALQLTMQVRNKVVEAYQEVMRMQV